jgi:hypothetical protein
MRAQWPESSLPREIVGAQRTGRPAHLADVLALALRRPRDARNEGLGRANGRRRDSTLTTGVVVGALAAGTALLWQSAHRMG